MYERFPNWMNKVAGEGSTARVRDRWAAVEQMAKAVSAPQVVDAVTHAFGYATPMTDALRAHAREVDTSYVTEDDALEVQILAAGTIASLLSGSSEHKNVAALATVSTAFGRKVPDFMCKDLLTLASQALQKAAQEKRTSPPVPTWNTKSLVDSITKMMPVPPEGGITGTAVLSAITTLLEHAKGQFARQTSAIGIIGTLQKESSALAFTIVSGYSETGQKLVSELPVGDAVFAVAHDLYDVTSLPPVLPSYEAIIRCLLRPMKSAKKPITVESIVNTLSDAVCLACNLDGKVPALAAPLHYLLQKKGEVPGGDWRPAFVQGSRLQADLSVTLESITQQIYVERCLLWSLEAA